MPQILAIAFWNVARTSPTLPPSAIRTSATRRRLPGAGQDHANIFENRGDRGVRLVNGDLDPSDTRKRREYVLCDAASRAFEQFIVGILERGRRGCDHIGIG